MINPDSLTANSTALCQPGTETFGDKELASELMTVPGAVKYAQEIAPTEPYGSLAQINAGKDLSLKRPEFIEDARRHVMLSAAWVVRLA
jgi:hypothetical protein